MRICVLNGSPKGKASITMQSVQYVALRFPEHDFQIIDICPRIKRIEKDENLFRELIEEVRSADGVLWAFPVFHLLVHSHYKRFIELIMEREVQDAFKGKYAAALTTSVHWFDHCAHNYVNAICDDLGMKYTSSFSADMDDFMQARERERLLVFADEWFHAIDEGAPTVRRFDPLHVNGFHYQPEIGVERLAARGEKVVLVVDRQEDGTNLGRMVERLAALLPKQTQIVNLRDIQIKGGCLACLQCGHDNRCAYEGKDGFIEFFESKVLPADILVFAGAITDRYLSSRWKMFFERMFYHRTNSPALTGKQLGFVLSGPLRQVPNLRQILEAFSEWQGAHLVDVVTDEPGSSQAVDALLEGLAKRLIRYAGSGFARPQTFLGVGGMKVFRDNAWGRKRFVFQADHRFYKQHGLYDFPHGDFRARIRNAFLVPLVKLPPVRKWFRPRINKLLLQPYQEILEKTEREH